MDILQREDRLNQTAQELLNAIDESLAMINPTLRNELEACMKIYHEAYANHNQLFSFENDKLAELISMQEKVIDYSGDGMPKELLDELKKATEAMNDVRKYNNVEGINNERVKLMKCHEELERLVMPLTPGTKNVVFDALDSDLEKLKTEEEELGVKNYNLNNTAGKNNILINERYNINEIGEEEKEQGLPLADEVFKSI